ncbi:MAG: glycosyltransferase family 39 protein [Burkholderiales bacterium]|nr:glycosyltransferase family 39 protein [Burkholderiales bacterium]
MPAPPASPAHIAAPVAPPAAAPDAAAADSPAAAAGRIAGVPAAWFWAGLLLLAGVWFFTLDVRHLLRSDEGRYAEIAREMFVSGDWVTIRYQGLKYFEKPPFHLWMTVLAYHAFGVGDWQARLWVALSGALGVAAVALAARRWWGPRTALLAALALLAAPAWNLGAHFNSLDMSVSGALAVVLAALLLAQHPATGARARRGWMLAAWAAMAVAVLTKGLIGIVLPGLALVVYTLIARDWALWRRLHLVGGTALFLLISAPWFVLVSLRNPEFPQFFFIHEHWDRYTSTIHHRNQPLWYFVPQLIGGFLPWLGLAPRGAAALRHEWAGRAFRPLLFSAAWAGAIFVFFSLSDSKLPGYILPVYPALALLAAAGLARLAAAPAGAAAWRRQIAAMLALAVLGFAASWLPGRWPAGGTDGAQLRAYGLWLAAACALLAAGLAGAWRLHRRGALVPSIGAYALAFFGATTLGLLGHETIGRPASGADLVPAIRAVLTPQMPLYGVRLLDHTLPFYLRHTLIMVEKPDELAFGTRREPAKWLPTLAAFEQIWRQGPHAMALMSHPTYARLQRDQLPMAVVAQDERRVVVANFDPPAR